MLLKPMKTFDTRDLKKNGNNIDNETNLSYGILIDFLTKLKHE